MIIKSLYIITILKPQFIKIRKNYYHHQPYVRDKENKVQEVQNGANNITVMK